MLDTCSFCQPQIEDRILAERNTVVAIADKYPVTEGHLLIIPKRHTEDYFTMTTEERNEATELLCELQKRMKKEDPQIAGFNVGVNSGTAAGQTIMHAHIHLIPRRRADTEKPRGGVRGVIPEKMGY